VDRVVSSCSTPVTGAEALAAWVDDIVTTPRAGRRAGIGIDAAAPVLFEPRSITPARAGHHVPPVIAQAGSR